MNIIQKYVQEFLAKRTEQVKFSAESETIDGTKIYTSAPSFDQKSDVFTLSPDGEKVVLADGDYELADGSKIVVKDGMIDTITPVEAPVEAEVEVEVEDEPAVEESPVEESPVEETPSEDVMTMIDALAAKVKELEDSIQSLKATNEKLSAQIVELNDAPSDAPIETKLSKIGNENTKKISAKAAAILEMRNNQI